MKARRGRWRWIAPAVGPALGVVALWGLAEAVHHAGPADRSTVAGLIELIRGGGRADRRDAAMMLGQVIGPGADPAARALVVALRDRDAEARARAARSLGALAAANPGVTGAAGALATALRDPDPLVRASAAIGLRAIGRDTPPAFDATLDGLRGSDPVVVSASATALAAWPVRDAADLRRLLGLLDDPAPAVRRAAREALTRPGLAIPAATALPVLSLAAREGMPPVREVVATVLGRSLAGVPAARDALMALLRADPDPAVRALAAASLGAFSEDGPARVALLAATDDPDLRARATASASLAIGRKSARFEALADLRSALLGDPARSGVAAEVESDPARAWPRLVAALSDPSPRVRAAAARALGEAFPPPTDLRPTVDALAIGLSDPDPLVRRASASTLARLGPAASPAAAPLRRALRDTDRRVSAQALVALQALGQPARR